MVKQGEDDLVSHGYCKKCLDAEKEAIKNRRLLKKLDAISQDFNHKFELFKNNNASFILESIQALLAFFQALKDAGYQIAVFKQHDKHKIPDFYFKEFVAKIIDFKLGND